LSEVTLTQCRWQSTKCALSIKTPLRCTYRGGAYIACIDLNRNAIKPSGLVERHRDCEWLFTSCARCTPNPERLSVCLVKMRKEQPYERLNLINFPPKIGFPNRNRVQQV